MATSPIITILEDIFVVPFEAAWADVKGVLGNLVSAGKTEVQTLLTDLATQEQNASTALSNAQAQVVNVVNPIVTKGVQGFAAAVETEVPGIAALVAAAEPAAETAATKLTDTVLIATIQALAGGLSQAAKATAAVNLSNLAGAS